MNIAICDDNLLDRELIVDLLEVISLINLFLIA